MKNLGMIILFLWSIIWNSGFGQNAKENLNPYAKEYEDAFLFIEEPPDFPGGKEKLTEFIYQRLRYPQEAKVNGIKGKVFTSFIVEPDGKITYPYIIKGIGSGCDEEALRIITSMPNWIPGKQGGKAVRVQFRLPVEFEYSQSSTDISSESDITSQLINFNISDRELKKDKKGNRIFIDGSIYEGDRKKKMANGVGKRIFADGSFYQGTFSNGYFNGQGILNDKTFSVYEGSFLSDKKHGLGKETYLNGDVYEGNFDNNLPTGQGKISYIIGGHYEGEWKDGKKEGQGKKVKSNGDIYVGSWKNNQPDGYGVYTTLIGDKYTGQWKEGKRSGQGTMFSYNGDICECEWKNDMQNGFGKVKFATGELYYGNFKDGKYSGEGEFISSVATYKGNYLDGKQNGIGKVVFHENGKVYEGEFKDDKYDGNGKLTVPELFEITGVFKNGKPDGYCIITLTKENTILKGNYINYEFEGETEVLWPDGMKYIGRIKNFKPDGFGVDYSASGYKTYEGNWLAGSAEGMGTTYYENGQISYTGGFKNGNRHGFGTEYNEAGQIIYEGEFEEGLKVGSQEPNNHSEDNQIANDNLTNDSNRSKAFNDYINKLYPEDAKFLIKVIDTYKGDPQNKCGKVCETLYSKCKWCSTNIKYYTYYHSRVLDLQDWAKPKSNLESFLGGMQNLTLWKILMNIASGSFFSDESTSTAKAFKIELDEIRNKKIYYCDGSAPNFCSERCEVEYSIYH